MCKVKPPAISVAQRVNYLRLRDGTLQLGNLGQHCVLIGQNVVHLLCNLVLSNYQQKMHRQRKHEVTFGHKTKSMCGFQRKPGSQYLQGLIRVDHRQNFVPGVDPA